MDALISCGKLAEGDNAVTPSVMCMNWLHWWYNHMYHVVTYSMALVFLTNMSDKCKITSPSANQVKNWWKTTGIEEKLDVRSQLEKGEWIVDIRCNVWLAHSTACTIRYNADRIQESAKSRTKVFLCAARLPQPYHNELYQKLWMWASYIFIALKQINILYRNVCILNENVYVLYIQYIQTL
jgi:hypothetical protein